MSEPFILVVPADPRFRVIAQDVAGRFAELSGGTAAAVQAAVKSAVDAIATGDNAAVTLTFRKVDARVDVELRCGSKTSTISCPL
jgi:hypothetical protein